MRIQLRFNFVKMKKLGEIIIEDIYLLEADTSNGNNSWEEDYRIHLLENEFRSFKIGIPFTSKHIYIESVIQFIESSKSDGSYFVYFNITNEENLLTIVNDYQSEITNKTFFILPEKNVKYSKLSAFFWDIQLLGYEIHLLKCDNMKECRLSPAIMNKYWQKGAKIGITGFSKHPIGFVRKKQLKELIRQKTFDYWITETINPKDLTYFDHIKLRLELL